MTGTPADAEYTQLVTALHSCCADRFETEREASHITLASFGFRGLKFSPDPGGKTLTISRTASWNASVQGSLEFDRCPHSNAGENACIFLVVVIENRSNQ